MIYPIDGANSPNKGGERDTGFSHKSSPLKESFHQDKDESVELIQQI